MKVLVVNDKNCLISKTVFSKKTKSIAYPRNAIVRKNPSPIKTMSNDNTSKTKSNNASKCQMEYRGGSEYIRDDVTENKKTAKKMVQKECNPVMEILSENNGRSIKAIPFNRTNHQFLKSLAPIHHLTVIR